MSEKTFEVVELSDDVLWLYKRFEIDGLLLHHSQYLVEADDGFVLIDAGEGHEEEMNQVLNSGTGGDDLDTLLLTHSILPHTGNVESIREKWEDVVVVSAANVPELAGVFDAEPKLLNSSTEIEGETFSFLDPLLTDVVASNWIYHHRSKILFTAEGVGHYHAPSQSSLTSDSMENGIEYEHIHKFNQDKLPYVHYLDPEKLRAGFDAVLEEFDVEYIAPIHGNPVASDDIDEYIDNILRSVEVFRENPEQMVS